MQNITRYITVFIMFFITIIVLFNTIDVSKNDDISLQHEILLKQAKIQNLMKVSAEDKIYKSMQSDEYEAILLSIEDRAEILKMAALVFLMIITALLLKQLTYSEELEKKIVKRTNEIMETKRLLQQIIDTDMGFIVLSENNNIVYLNQNLLNYIGYLSVDEFNDSGECLSKYFGNVQDVENLNEFLTKDTGSNWLNNLHNDKQDTAFKVMMPKDDQDRYYKIFLKKFQNNNTILSLVKFNEITVEHTKIQNLAYKASRDSLTKLFNRSKLNEVISQNIETTKSFSSSFCILFLDVDFFKKVNDTYGHDVGDSVLIDVAQVMLSITRQRDIVGRWGGEEFIIVLESSNITQAHVLAEKVRLAIKQYDFLEAGKITISIGIAQFKENDTQATVIKRADEALYEAKNTGRDKVISRL